MLKRNISIREKELVKVRENYQVTIPYNLRRYVNLTVGDYVEVNLKNNQLVIKPVKIVAPDQEYFYTKEWQKKEAEADEDIAAGRVEGPFKNIKEMLKNLKSSK